MNLTFLSADDARGTNRKPTLSISNKGKFMLSAAAAVALKQKVGGAVALAVDEQGGWYLVVGAPGAPFTWRANDTKNAKCLAFSCMPRAQDYYRAQQVDFVSQPSITCAVGKAVAYSGAKAYPLLPLNSSRKQAALPGPDERRPDEATLFRLTETVRELGAGLLKSRPELELTRALGLLQTHAKWLPTIPGAVPLLEKLQAHFAA